MSLGQKHDIRFSFSAVAFGRSVANGVGTIAGQQIAPKQSFATGWIGSTVNPQSAVRNVGFAARFGQFRTIDCLGH